MALKRIQKELIDLGKDPKTPKPQNPIQSIFDIYCAFCIHASFLMKI